MRAASIQRWVGFAGSGASAGGAGGEGAERSEAGVSAVLCSSGRDACRRTDICRRLEHALCSALAACVTSEHLPSVLVGVGLGALEDGPAVLAGLLLRIGGRSGLLVGPLLVALPLLEERLRHGGGRSHGWCSPAEQRLKRPVQRSSAARAARVRQSRRTRVCETLQKSCADRAAQHGQMIAATGCNHLPAFTGRALAEVLCSKRGLSSCYQCQACQRSASL